MKGNGSGLTELECVIATRDSVTITIIHQNLTVSTWGTVIKMKKNASIGNITLSARPNYKDTFARNGKTPVLIANVLNHRKVSPCLRTQRNSLRNYFLVRNKFVWISLFEKKIYDIFDMNKGGKSHQEHSPGAANNAVHVNSLLLNF